MNKFYAVCTIDIVNEDGIPVETLEDQVYPMQLVSSDVDPITRMETNIYEMKLRFMNMQPPSAERFMDPDIIDVIDRNRSVFELRR